MIVAENLTINDRAMVKHYSDLNKYIKQVETDVEYAEAIDIVPCRYTYIETDRDIEENKEG